LRCHVGYQKKIVTLTPEWQSVAPASELKPWKIVKLIETGQQAG
jgi:hypothetical protein